MGTARHSSRLCDFNQGGFCVPHAMPCEAVLRICDPGSARSAADRWWHVSYGNLSSNVFTVVPLALNSDETEFLPEDQALLSRGLTFRVSGAGGLYS